MAAAAALVTAAEMLEAMPPPAVIGALADTPVSEKSRAKPSVVLVTRTVTAPTSLLLETDASQQISRPAES
uniref:hypothetical protein n=1 Tax=Pandoraea pnomenusa TaxID=93220 RepID=UPI001184CD0B|nr:hypothetical protein [Pandoraea pnomenusa]